MPIDLVFEPAFLAKALDLLVKLWKSLWINGVLLTALFFNLRHVRFSSMNGRSVICFVEHIWPSKRASKTRENPKTIAEKKLLA